MEVGGMNIDNPLVSIVIPVYNVEKYISQLSVLV